MQNHDNINILGFCARYHHYETLEFLLEKGADNNEVFTIWEGITSEDTFDNELGLIINKYEANLAPENEKN